jgi:acetyltransferase
MSAVRLRSGKQVTIRPIRPDDADALRAAYDRLSPASKHRRFLAPKPHLSSAEARYLVHVDGSSHQAFVGTPPERPDQILAVARFVRLPEDPLTAEIAVVVGENIRGDGLASALLARLAAAASDHGVRRFRATMLADNTPAHAMVRRFAGGDAVQRRLGHVLEVDIPLLSVAR